MTGFEQGEMHPQRWGDPAAATALPETARGLIEMAFGIDERPAVEAPPLPAPAIDAAQEAGLLFYRMDPTSVRLVTSWQTTADEVTEAGARFREAVLAGAS